jgi:hypothetical protein
MTVTMRALNSRVLLDKMTMAAMRNVKIQKILVLITIVGMITTNH